MKQVIIAVEEDLYRFYQKIGKAAGGRSAETVMAVALFQLAGQLSSQMIGKQFLSIYRCKIRAKKIY